MIVRFELSALRRIRGRELLTRFAFGGLVTVAAGLVAKRYGPVVGGLFLAFPGISPAGVTIVERHEIVKKRRRGVSGVRRGRAVAGTTSAGAALGSIGLAAFGVTAAWWLPRVAAWEALLLATIAWLAVACASWFLRFRF